MKNNHKLLYFFLVVCALLLIYYLINNNSNAKIETLDTSDLPDNKSLYYKRFLERGFIYDKEDIVK